MSAPTIRAYTSNVYAFGPAIVCAGATVVVVAGLLAVAGVPVPVLILWTVLIAAIAAGFAALTAMVRVSVNVDEIGYRSGFSRWRWFRAEDVRQAQCRAVGRLAIIGVGIRPTRAVTRHIVGAGDALHLQLASGEHVWLSIRGRIPDDLLPIKINNDEETAPDE